MNRTLKLYPEIQILLIRTVLSSHRISLSRFSIDIPGIPGIQYYCGRSLWSTLVYLTGLVMSSEHDQLQSDSNLLQ